jgi:hypothetical protein
LNGYSPWDPATNQRVAYQIVVQAVIKFKFKGRKVDDGIIV